MVSSIMDGAVADLVLFDPAEQATLLANQQILHDIVAAGPGAFDSAAMLATATAALDAMDALATLECDGFLAQDVPLASAFSRSALLIALCLAGFVLLRRMLTADGSLDEEPA